MKTIDMDGKYLDKHYLNITEVLEFYNDLRGIGIVEKIKQGRYSMSVTFNEHALERYLHFIEVINSSNR